MTYGTLSVTDLLATTQQSVAEVGEQRIFETLQDDLNIHNGRVRQMRAALAETTTDRQRRYGGNDAMVMEDIAEFGTPDAQKVAAGATVGFPLRLAGVTIQWTRKWFQNHTAAELAAQYTAAKAADIKRIERDIKRALFTATNSTFVDRLVDVVSLSVKALVNADSAAIPLGPEGDSFDGATHTHYLGTGSFVAADLTGLIDTVLEHHNTGQVMVYINKAQEAAVRAFTGFTAYTDPRLMLGTQANQPGARLDLLNPTNRAIGIFGPAEIWVKPWIPASYLFAWVAGAPPPLAFRIRNPQADALVIAADDEVHPLRAQSMEREFGVGVWTRTNGAALYTGNATYASPTITA
jgi:hypothetical protein